MIDHLPPSTQPLATMLDEAEPSGSAKPSNSFLVLSSNDDDDEAANEYLSLKIVEKALLMRTTKLVPDAAADDYGDAGVLHGTQGAIDGGGNGSSSSVLGGEVVESPSGRGRKVIVPFGSNKKIVKKKKKIEKMEVQDQSLLKKHGWKEGTGLGASQQGRLEPVQAYLKNNKRGLGADKVKKTAKKPHDTAASNEKNDRVVVVNDKEEEETVEALNMVELVDPNAVEKTDNIVFRKLLRGPKYFDPPDSGWGACFNCGEEGHTMANCTAAKRKKPCFVCGSLELNAKQCSKGH